MSNAPPPQPCATPYCRELTPSPAHSRCVRCLTELQQAAQRYWEVDWWLACEEERRLTGRRWLRPAVFLEDAEEDFMEDV